MNLQDGSNDIQLTAFQEFYVIEVMLSFLGTYAHVSNLEQWIFADTNWHSSIQVQVPRLGCHEESFKSYLAMIGNWLIVADSWVKR